METHKPTVSKCKLKPMNEMPRWAYIDSEFEDIEFRTVEIVDGVRMIYDRAGQRKLDEEALVEQERTRMMEETPSLGLIL